MVRKANKKATELYTPWLARELEPNRNLIQGSLIIHPSCCAGGCWFFDSSGSPPSLGFRAAIGTLLCSLHRRGFSPLRCLVSTLSPQRQRNAPSPWWDLLLPYIIFKNLEFLFLSLFKVSEINFSAFSYEYHRSHLQRYCWFAVVVKLCGGSLWCRKS